MNIEALIRHYGILVAALLIFLTEFGIPTGIPNEVVLVLAGSYSVHSALGLALSFVLVTAADVLGTTSLYLLTRTGGVRILRRFQKQDRSRKRKSSRWREWLRRHDVAVIMVARSLPFVRMSVAISAGLMRIRRKNYMLGVIPGGMLWAGVPLTLGYLFRNDVHRLVNHYESVADYGLLILPVLALLALLVWFVRRRRGAQQPEGEPRPRPRASLPHWNQSRLARRLRRRPRATTRSGRGR